MELRTQDTAVWRGKPGWWLMGSLLALSSSALAQGCGTRGLAHGGDDSQVATRGDGAGGVTGAAGQTSTGAGGVAGAQGWPGTGGGPFGGPCDQPVASCVRSCGQDLQSPSREVIFQICDRGALRCPDGTVDTSSCPPDSCARSRVRCCDPTTGAFGIGACQADGARACPAQTPEENPYHTCVPAELAASGCNYSLFGQPCGAAARYCEDSAIWCTCAVSDEHGGMSWRCDIRVP